MLRITTHSEQGVTQFVVEGKLAGPCVNELEKCWTTLIARESADRVVVDITSVTFVDGPGKELLSRMFDHGTKFTARLLMSKAIIQEIECGHQENAS